MPAKQATRPRRKAKHDRSRQTVRDLLEGAARVLEREGYADASTNRIAEAAGLSVGSLYEYFPNKEAIFEALVRQEIDVIAAAIRGAPVDADAPLHDSLHRVLELSMAAMRRGPEFLRSLQEVPGAVFRRHLATVRAETVAYVRTLLEARRHELRVSDLDLAAFIVVSAAEGIGASVSEDRFDDRLSDETAALLTLYLTGENVRRSS